MNQVDHIIVYHTGYFLNLSNNHLFIGQSINNSPNGNIIIEMIGYEIANIRLLFIFTDHFRKSSNINHQFVSKNHIHRYLQSQ